MESYGSKPSSKRDKPEELAKEFKVLELYYSPTSKVRGSARDVGVEVGYSKTSAQVSVKRILKRYKNMDLDKAFTVLGVDKLYCALGIKTIMDSSTAKAADKLAAFRLRLACAGETLEPAKAAPPVQQFTGPVMIIQGMTPEKMKALKSGGRHELPDVESGSAECDQETPS